jgi:hypothetical protein
MWDPSMERLEGPIAPGEKLKVFTKLSPGRGFPIRVTDFVPGKRWSGRAACRWRSSKACAPSP